LKDLLRDIEMELMENKEFLAAPDNELPFVSNLIETRNVDKDEGDINS
jgi:hypothetical protein